MNELNIILIHGKDTNPSQKWYPWLKEVVEKEGISFAAPTLPKPEDPVLSEWLDEINKLEPNENSILIGHSRGGVAILRWLERQPEGKKIKKVILVAANNPGVENKQNKNTHGFYEEGPYKYDMIKKHCDKFIVLHSTDDEWVPFTSGEENVRGLSAKFYKFDDKGHFANKLPKKEIPEVLNEIIAEK